ncbi:MAG: arginine decarboxylase, pyruvoyl-dependent [Deltaproteobacteria bacterium]|nr:arginine decarboxylase, pyruvoyl-dependent [Deltaproteobacteria bacterium]
MFETPDIYTLASGLSEGTSKLGAFDIAILKAGIGNTNLIKLSSILPPNSTFTDKIIYPKGVLVPVAYGYAVSNKRGETISASVAIAISKQDGFGVIMEYSGVASAKDAEETVKKMAEDAMNYRNIEIKEIKSIAIEHTVTGGWGCVFAGVPMWYSKLL